MQELAKVKSLLELQGNDLEIKNKDLENKNNPIDSLFSKIRTLEVVIEDFQKQGSKETEKKESSMQTEDSAFQLVSPTKDEQVDCAKKGVQSYPVKS